MNPDLTERLGRYLANRAQQRADHAQTFLDGLSHREKRLIREAAVMGWVLGARSVPGALLHAKIPGDNDIVHTVVEHCQSTADLYPLIGGGLTGIIEWLVRHMQPVNPAPLAEAAAELAGVPVDEATAAIGRLVDGGTLTIGADGVREEL